MSQATGTPALPRASEEPVGDLDGGLAISASDILERLWRVFTSMRTALVLMLCLTALSFVGTLLMQAPSGLQSDPPSYAAWLNTLRPKYGGWTDVLDKLQFLSIFQSVWFKAIMVGLTTSILACSVNRLRGLWKTAVHPRTKMTGTFYERAPHRASLDASIEMALAVDGVRKAFKGRHFRTVVEEDGDAVHVYADRFRWAPFGTLMAHISLVVILVGALVSSSLGFRDTGVAAPIGTKVDVGHGTGLTLLAKSFEDSYYPTTGAPADYASDIALYRGSTAVAERTIRVNQPMQYEGLTIYQSFYGPTAQMRVVDASGKVLFDGGVPLAWGSSDKNKRLGQLPLPGANLNVLIVGVASGEVDSKIKPGQMQLEVYRADSTGTPVALEIVSQGKPANLAGLEFMFLRERQFTGLIVARDPGVGFVWAGSILMMLGLCLVFFFPNRRIWARLQRAPDGTEVRFGATSRHDATFAPDFQDLVGDMKLALTGPSAS